MSYGSVSGLFQLTLDLVNTILGHWMYRFLFNVFADIELIVLCQVVLWWLTDQVQISFWFKKPSGDRFTLQQEGQT